MRPLGGKSFALEPACLRKASASPNPLFSAMTIFGTIWGKPIDRREEKEGIARAVAARAQRGEVIGAGSGSTSFLTVLALGERSHHEALDLAIVPTSLEIEWAATAVGLRLVAGVPSQIDWCFDGTDEVDAAGRLIKGRGGALLRERLVLDVASRFVLVADASKDVERLGSRHAVPVEVRAAATRNALEELGKLDGVESASVRWAVAKDGPVLTELGNVLIDVRCREIDDSAQSRIMAVQGVQATGLFEGYRFERV